VPNTPYGKPFSRLDACARLEREPDDRKLKMLEAARTVKAGTATAASHGATEVNCKKKRKGFLCAL
jgi:hypothetical protein